MWGWAQLHQVPHFLRASFDSRVNRSLASLWVWMAGSWSHRFPLPREGYQETRWRLMPSVRSIHSKSATKKKSALFAMAAGGLCYWFRHLRVLSRSGASVKTVSRRFFFIFLSTNPSSIKVTHQAVGNKETTTHLSQDDL